MAWTIPRLALENARPASRLASIIRPRKLTLSGILRVGSRFEEIRLIASRAKISVMGEWAVETYDSMA
jgi:hypothetical protein